VDRELPVASADEALAGELEPELSGALADLVAELVAAADPAAVLVA